ncbi:hypothetical protein PILCRDRAFT_819352 [Piloderma croceum F 1598]|uniref:Uncharacterized protein n=1 Tax=Piloderma croceum (strain F 1598) TaxID=765440 RepID=A0A0C3BBQ0_PILCF|nr:hypothetical protein PILCRDRAFT_819352 [Piloderma croceum F 1598]
MKRRQKVARRLQEIIEPRPVGSLVTSGASESITAPGSSAWTLDDPMFDIESHTSPISNIYQQNYISCEYRDLKFDRVGGWSRKAASTIHSAGMYKVTSPLARSARC